MVLGEKAVSRSMKGKGDPAFEKRMKVLNLARTCFMIMDADDSGTLSRDEILTALKEDKRVIGFMRECKEAVLRDLLDPEKIEANLEEVDADKSGEIDMEEWINAVTLSLNAEMEKEKAARERAAAALEEACEGEDLDAIDAALATASEAGVAEEALAKAQKKKTTLERKARGSRFSRGSRASRASRDSLPDEEKSVHSQTLSVHDTPDAAAPAPAPIEDEAAPPSSAAGRMEQADQRPKTSRGPSTPRKQKRGWFGLGKKETPVSPPSAAVSPEKAGPASHGTPGGPAEAPAEAPAEDRVAAEAAERRAAKEKEYAAAEAARVAAEKRREEDEEAARKIAAEEKAKEDEVAARANKPQIDAILADRDTSKQQKILAINRLKDLPATVKQRAMQAAQTGGEFKI